jgi:hypothetical protein
MNTKLYVSALLFLCLFSPLAKAQVQTQDTQQSPVTQSSLTIPARTPVRLQLQQTLSSKTTQQGTVVEWRVFEDVIIDGTVVIAKDSRAYAEVTHVQKAGFGGRPGEMLLTARYLDMGAQKIKMRALQPETSGVGKSQSDASYALGATAAATVPVLGFAAVFITGGEIIIPEGTLATAMTAAEWIIPLSAINP